MGIDGKKMQCFNLLVRPQYFYIKGSFQMTKSIQSLFVFLSEKHKAEMKDRKVLEILQSKDDTIKELQQV